MDDDMRKVLYIGFKRYNSILNGGGLENERTLRILRKEFGDDCVDEYYMIDERIGRSLWSKLLAVYYTLFDYHNGLTPKKVHEIIAKANENYDYVFISTSVLGILAKALKEAGYKGKVIVHFHNIEEIYYDAITPKWLPGRQFVVRCAAHNDRYSCDYADKIITLSKRDSDYLFAHYGRKADAVIGIGLKDRCKSVIEDGTMTKEVANCLFLGSYFAPNNEGVLWFVNNVLPYVNIRFRIVGKGMATLKQQNECLKDVEVLSDVPDLEPFFQEADFMILPIFSGSGMKVKTCESLMYGKNIIGSDETFEGYEIDANRAGKRCNTAEEYIAAINEFCRHPIKRFNVYSRQAFLENYSEEVTDEKFLKVF